MLWRIPSPHIIAVCRKDHLCYTSSRPFLVVVGILGLFSLSWAISTRPSWRQARNRTLRLLALCRGSGCVYCVLVPCAQLLARSRLVLVPCGLCWALLDVFSHPREIW